MILTVTVNAAVDKTLTVANLQLGHRHRAQQGLVMAGGKGVNVARALKRLGEPVIATGLAGGHNGAPHPRRDDRRGHPERLRPHPRRVAHLDRGRRPDASVQTEIYEYGPEVVEDELALLVEKLRYLSGAVTTVVLAGQPAAQGADLVLRRHGARHEQAQGAHRDRLRRRAAAKGAPRPSRRSSRRPSARPRRSSGTSSRPTRTSSTGSPRSRRWARPTS